MTNETKHTPTPWASDDYVIYSLNGEHIAHTDNTMRSPDEDDANAAHIVKCVNMHDELVEVLNLACQDLADWIEATEDDDNYQLGDTRMIIGRIKETLKKACAL